MANINYTTWTDFQDTFTGLINIPWANLTTTQQTGIKQYYNNNAYEGWIANNWLTICPVGEARFVGNQGFYPNNLSNATYWTNTALTVTANAIANPADGKTSASQLLETSATSAHSSLQNLTYIPGATYQLTVYARPIGGRYLYLVANDGTNTYYAFFNPATGALGTYSNNMTSVPTITQAANGFWICSLYFTAATTAGSGTYGVQLSSDGSTLSYSGTTTKGMYVWGLVMTQTTYTSPASLLIPYDQPGEDFIDSVYQAYQQTPTGANNPVPQGGMLTPDGVQIIATNSSWTWNGLLWSLPSWFVAGYPIFLNYRKGPLNLTGTTYSGASTYAVGDQILYTGTASPYLNKQNFYKCIVATTAGQSPDTNPTSWQIIQLPDFLFPYVLYACAADFYRSEAQFAQAKDYDDIAESELERQADKFERQQGLQPPFRVQTHAGFQARGWISR